MTTVSLSAAHALLDLMPGRAALRKTLAASPLPTLEAVPVGGNWLRTLRDRMVRRARQRAIEAAFARLAETSEHLLVDIGEGTVSGAAERPAEVAWTRALPAPGAGPAGPRTPGRRALPRSRRRLLELDDRLLADAGLTRAQAVAEAGPPRWNGPEHWLR